MIYDANREVQWLQHDTNAITDVNLQHFTALPITSYDQAFASPAPHLLITFPGGWNWIDNALAQDHALIIPLGTSFGGEALSIQMPQPSRKIGERTAR